MKTFGGKPSWDNGYTLNAETGQWMPPPSWATHIIKTPADRYTWAEKCADGSFVGEPRYRGGVQSRDCFEMGPDKWQVVEVRPAQGEQAIAPAETQRLNAENAELRQRIDVQRELITKQGGQLGRYLDEIARMSDELEALQRQQLAAHHDLQALARIGTRFQGVDLKFRRGGVDWPAAWRAECFSAKHEGVRLHAHGETPEAAIQALQAAVAAWDSAQSRTLPSGGEEVRP